MQSWVKQVVLGVIAVVAVWMLVIIYWRTNAHLPSTSDIVIYLLLAPVALLLFVVVVRNLRPALVALGTATNASQAANPDTAKIDISTGSENGWVLSSVATSIISKYGRTVDELIEAMLSRQANFDLDPIVVDAHGYPVLSGRIADLEESKVLSQYIEWAAPRQLTSLHWEPEDKRAIALAHDVFLELVQQLVNQAPFVERLQNEAKAPHAELDWPMLYLGIVLPKRWSESQTQTIKLWFIDMLMAQGWPQDKFSMDIFADTAASQSLQILDRFNVQKHRQQQSGLYLLMASQSYLGEKTYEELLSGVVQEESPVKSARILGEGAAGLILADQLWSEKLGLQSMTQIHRVAQHQRGKSADDAGKIKPDTLIAAMNDALVAAGVQAGEVVTIAADTDSRSGRVGELFEAVYAVTPDLDIEDNCFRVETACGALGGVSALIALLIARYQAAESSQATLCISNNDSFQRAALLLKPAEKPETAQPA